MSGGADDARSAADVGGAPIDFDRLNVVTKRFATDDRFTGIEVQPEFAPDRIVCRYDPGFYPQRVESARLAVVWFENGDFSLHYHEDHDDGTFDHRWDRHPSDHDAVGAEEQYATEPCLRGTDRLPVMSTLIAPAFPHDSMVFVSAVAYRWHAREHPDPERADSGLDQE